MITIIQECVIVPLERKETCLNTQCRFTHKRRTRRETVARSQQNHIDLPNNIHRQKAGHITSYYITSYYILHHTTGTNSRSTKEKQTLGQTQTQQEHDIKDTFLDRIQELQREIRKTFKM